MTSILFETAKIILQSIGKGERIFMKARFVFRMGCVMVFLLLLTCCGTKTLDEATQAVDAYNEVATEYNSGIEAYNASLVPFREANEALQECLNTAQLLIDAGEEPFDADTLTVLEDAMISAQNSFIPVPEELDRVELLSINDNAKKNELEEVKTKAEEETERVITLSIPMAPEIPDYSDAISSVNASAETYKKSIQSMKQITAPKDEFVIERLHHVETISLIEAVTEEHDPNKLLGKQGGYIGCIYFRDSAVNQSLVYVDGDPDDVVEIGTEGGGAVEIYNSREEAEKRDAYLGTFDGTIFVSGSHYVYGTIVIRTSQHLTGSQQLDLTDRIIKALNAVD